MSHRSRKFANCFEQPFSFSFSTTSPPESSTRDESRKSTRGGRSIESNCGWSDRNSCAKKTFGFLRRKTWLFVPYFWKRWKNPFVDRMLAGQVRWIFEINLWFLIYCNFIGRLILENRKNWCRKIDVQVIYIYIYIIDRNLNCLQLNK